MKKKTENLKIIQMNKYKDLSGRFEKKRFK